jgi:hypothetical protein
MDLDDFLWLKNQLCLKSLSETAPFCFRSPAVGIAPVGLFFGFFLMGLLGFGSGFFFFFFFTLATFSSDFRMIKS